MGAETHRTPTSGAALKVLSEAFDAYTTVLHSVFGKPGEVDVLDVDTIIGAAVQVQRTMLHLWEIVHPRVGFDAISGFQPTPKIADADSVVEKFDALCHQIWVDTQRFVDPAQTAVTQKWCGNVLEQFTNTE